jgi:response regulator of citrate/malate metabolism
LDNQHQKIKGYRDLSQEEIDLMNAVKAKGNEMGDLIKELQALETTDKRWVAIGQTNLQQGIMALVRAIAKPESF